jgi:flavin reductase (DIM6/NTAB) family NADH-FMN oxidoreductase RutF
VAFGHEERGRGPDRALSSRFGCRTAQESSVRGPGRGRPGQAIGVVDISLTSVQYFTVMEGACWVGSERGGFRPLGVRTRQGLEARFREVMAGVCTPVSVVTATADGLPYGTTVSAFASLSMEPPMVLVSLGRGSDLLPVLCRSSSFGLNVLSSTQSALAMTFARKGGTDKFTGVRWGVDAGVPRLPGAAGFLACDVAGLVEGGDHVVVLGLVRAAETLSRPPLTYHARAYGTHAAFDDRDGELTRQ